MKRFLKDSSINIISNLVVVVAIQLLTFPIISKGESEQSFAELVVLYGIALIFATTFGNTLNNVRLLHNPNLGHKIKEKVFSKFFVIILILNAIVLTIIFFFYVKEFGVNQILFVAFSLLLTARYYLQVYFRENLNYTRILITNICVALGYLIGVMIYKFIVHESSLPFLLGEGAGFVYLVLNTEVKFKLHKDIKITYNGILKDYSNFSSINLIINILNYLDRLILLPIIGATAVTTYFIGSTASKMISLITTPMNNVILSYLSIGTNNIHKKNFNKLQLLLLSAMIPLFFIIKYMSLLIIYIIYKNYFDQAESIIDLVTIICLLSIYNSIIHPFGMKILKSKLLLYIQVGYAIIYLSLALVGSYAYNLIGFCIATVIAMALKLVYTNIKISEVIKKV